MKTPMMRQFLNIKKEHQDEILLFRMGDFYETFYEDARTVSKVLGITLTARSKSKDTGDQIPLAGFPYHALDGYLSKLIKAGYRVAVCEQTEDPAKAKGLVKRDVVEVITPGTLISGSALDERLTLLLCSAFSSGGRAGLAFCDLSTGEIDATEMNGDLMEVEIARRAPSEILLKEGGKEFAPAGCEPTYLEPWKFDLDTAGASVGSVLDVQALEGLGAGKDSPAISALGALLSYVRDTKRMDVAHLYFSGMYRRTDSLIIDRGSAVSLNITEASRGEESGVLSDVTDETLTPAGSREWRKWLSSPSRRRDEIESRYGAVQWFAEDAESLNEVSAVLENTADLQRQAGKLGTMRSAPRDLRAIADTLEVIPDICHRLRDSGSELLQEIASVDPLDELRERIDSVLVERPPARISDGGFVRDGVSDELDQFRDVHSGGHSWITSKRDEEREKTGIPNLTISSNKVFGYYIEVSKSHLEKVPDHYIRKQTLVNAERFITPELKEVEARIFRAGEEIERLEKEVFEELLAFAAGYIDGIRRAGKMLAALDVVMSLAKLAVERNYVRPELTDSPGIKIVSGRHPVLDVLLPQGECVPNSVELDQRRRILLVTGPNMAGKSTYLRQVALLVVMAQAGSFVPAESMVFAPVDRIFTRIGSSDRITRGQSTFLVEMAEAAALLNSSTPSSLAILDEVGRGTSTFDGLSLAWAMVEYLHDSEKHRPLVLFATHYHELTALGNLLPAVDNVNVKVRDTGGKVVFLYSIEEGSTDKSYGIHVASMAGVPSRVVRRARKVLKDLESGRHLMAGGSDENQMELGFESVDEREDEPLAQEIREIDPDSITPRKALEILYRLRDSLD
ncbi:MAG: DNA mismatch repair protein MutS [Candidatus Aegiribacteria sp.]|nr:DNA mismatch repair protein MutS [Candidatus Aegiribacteria sp.]MBD3295120.1 DNA mismatch repair protein MutS [Candidatus Fermentibacteria bacterium]